jgi:hypothetical protein
MTDETVTLDMDAKMIEQARQLVIAGTLLAQKMNNTIFRDPQFKAWSDESMLKAFVCLAAGNAKLLAIPKDQFLLFASVAYEGIGAEKRTHEDPDAN